MKKFWRILWRGLLLAGALLLAYQVWLLGHVLWWTQNNPASTAFMDARLDEMREDNPAAKLQHQWVPYNRISPHLKRALVAAEDGKFLDHEGFDWDGIEKAFEKNLKKGRIVAGGSTISQQLAKNLFLSKSKNPFRKLQEAIITVMLETTMSKRRIFEIYLNVIEWGDGVFGAEAAARKHFRTSAASLGPDQAARLAGMVPNPVYFDRHPNSKGLAKRTAIIAGRMNSAAIP
jgi:monofunctional biosynthetic peptidoglycan transglycosylase